MEEFIERSNALLTARPCTTRVSTRYTHKNVADGGDRVDPSAKPAKVVVKTYDPHSGLIYKYKVKKANELSRVLASLGPQFFEFESERKQGAASVMSGVEPPEPVSEPHVSVNVEDKHETHKETEEPAAKASSKSKKKKKSKK